MNAWMKKSGMNGVGSQLVADLRGLGRDRMWGVLGGATLFASLYLPFMSAHGINFVELVNCDETEHLGWLCAAIIGGWIALPRLSAGTGRLFVRALPWVCILLAVLGGRLAVETHTYLVQSEQQSVADAKATLLFSPHTDEQIRRFNESSNDLQIDPKAVAAVEARASGDVPWILPGLGFLVYFGSLTALIMTAIRCRRAPMDGRCASPGKQ